MIKPEVPTTFYTICFSSEGQSHVPTKCSEKVVLPRAIMPIRKYSKYLSSLYKETKLGRVPNQPFKFTELASHSKSLLSLLYEARKAQNNASATQKRSPKHEPNFRPM